MQAAAPIAMAMMVAGQVSDGIEGNRAMRRGARADMENARLTLLQGEQEALSVRRTERQAAGEMIAEQGLSGTMIGTGSNLDMLRESAFQRELDILNLRTGARGEANNLEQAARDKRAAGRQALVKAAFGAVSTALAGAQESRLTSRMIDQNKKRRIEEKNRSAGGSGKGG